MSSDGAPSASRQGEFEVGILVRAKVFLELRRADHAAELQGVGPLDVHVGLDTEFVRWRSCAAVPGVSEKGSALGVYLAVLPNEAVGREHGARLRSA